MLLLPAPLMLPAVCKSEWCTTAVCIYSASLCVDQISDAIATSICSYLSRRFIWLYSETETKKFATLPFVRSKPSDTTSTAHLLYQATEKRSLKECKARQLWQKKQTVYIILTQVRSSTWWTSFIQKFWWNRPLINKLICKNQSVRTCAVRTCAVRTCASSQALANLLTQMQTWDLAQTEDIL